MKRVLFLSLFVLVTVVGVAVNRATSTAEISSNADLDGKLAFQVRGLGVLDTRFQEFDLPGGAGSQTTFTARDESSAAMVASKFLTDYVWGPVQLAVNPEISGTVLHGEGIGWWRLGLDGSKFQVLFARNEAGLATLTKRFDAQCWKPIEGRKHPLWMDGFDKSSVGFWVDGGGVLAKNRDKDLQWLADHQFTACFADFTENRLVAPSILDDSTMEWQEFSAEKYKIPYRSLLSWSRPVSPRWLWNRVQLPYRKPLDGYLPGGDLEHLEYFNDVAFTPSDATDPIQFNLHRQIAARMTLFPNFIGHHGSAEIGSTGIPDLAGIGSEDRIQQLWRVYLRDYLHLSLDEVGINHKNSPKAFTSWEQVSIPDPKEIFGWNSDSFDLRKGDWEGANDANNVGKEEKWFVKTSKANWVAQSCNDPLTMLSREKNRGNRSPSSTFWLRRNFTLDADQSKNLKFLHVSRARWHHYPFDASKNNEANIPDVYVNGSPARPMVSNDPVRADDDLCFSLGGALVAGENTITIDSKGIQIPSYIFLSNLGRWEYPSLDTLRNRMYYDTVNFVAWLRARNLEQTLIAIRAGDANRPIKIMGPDSINDLIGDLCTRYGAYLHDTGQTGACWAPWMLRFGIARGQVTSSEPGGPPADAKSIREMFTLYLMLGNSAVDMVFHPQHYRETGDVSQWIDEHLDLIHCIGKMTMEPPSVGILRSTRTVRLKFPGPWSWDLGRGELQSVGRTFNYAELDDVVSGKVGSMYRVLIDDGTALMTDEDIEGLERFVSQGGIFIALHNTGMHSPEKAWSWPIARLSGLDVAFRGEIGGTLKFGSSEGLWPTLQGKEVSAQGIVLDWQKDNVTGDSLALKPSKDQIEVIATWKDRDDTDGRIAIAARRLGKGRVIVLGSSFWRNARDSGGNFQGDSSSGVYLDELLDTLGVPRMSWRTGGDATRDVFVEHWRSKNGIFDLYPVARIDTSAREPVTLDVSWRRSSPVTSLMEISKAKCPILPLTIKDDVITLSNVSLEPMESRVFAAPRSDIERAPLFWAKTQQAQWPVLNLIPEEKLIPQLTTASDVLPLSTGWLMTTGSPWESVPSEDQPKGEKSVKLGTFDVLGLPEDAVAHFRKTIEIPKEWTGSRVYIRFDCEHWFWGINPKGRLWVNDTKAPFSVSADQVGGFAFEVTDLVRDGKLDLALEVDGRASSTEARKGRPSGVTGMFYLQAEPPPVATTTLGGWQKKDGLGIPDTAKPPQAFGQYWETRFVLPEHWLARRIFIEIDPSLRYAGWLMLNETPIKLPPYMRSLDISGLVRRDKENIIRWIPKKDAGETSASFSTRVDGETAPQLTLNWMP